MATKKNHKKMLLLAIASLSYAGNVNAENEIIVGDQYGGLYVWASNGNGTFNTTPYQQPVRTFDQNRVGDGMFYGQNLTSNGGVGTTLFADLNNDEYLDFFMPSQWATDPDPVYGQRDGFRSWLNDTNGKINGTSIPTGPIDPTQNIGTIDTDSHSFSADVTGDGNVDYIHTYDGVRVYPGNGAGGFSLAYIDSQLTRPAGEWLGISLTGNYYLVDIDGDNVKDIVSAHVTRLTYGGQPLMTGYLRAHAGNGNGTFSTNAMFDVRLERPGGYNADNNNYYAIGISSKRVGDFADIDADGDLDYIYASEDSGTGQIWAYLNNGTSLPFTLSGANNEVLAVKTNVTAYPFGELSTFAGHDDVSAGFFRDLDGKNGADYISLNTGYGTAVYLSNGDGTFSTTPIETEMAGLMVGYTTKRTTHMGELSLRTVSNDGDKDGITNLIDPEPKVPVSPPICTIPTPDTDTDNDGITDACENSLVNRSGSSDALDPDSDDDGLTDGQELIGRNASGVLFYDTDGILGTDPNIVDTDRDRLPDYVEVTVKGTDPSNLDTDHDGYSDRVDPSPLDPAIP